MKVNIEDQPDGSNPQEVSQEPKHQDRWHVVQSGDNLTTIAQDYFGPANAHHWITLYNFNRELIGENPDLIRAGIEIRIPDISEFL